MTTVFMVGLRLLANNSDELLARIHDWEIYEGEGVTTISGQPELVEVPPSLQPPPQDIGPSRTPTQLPAPPE